MQSITLKGISKSFGKVRALVDINLEIEAGKRLVLIGGSGAGKTTLLRILAGLETPDDGAISCGTNDITLTPAHQRGIAMLSQDYAMYPHLTIERNLLAAIEPMRLSAQERTERLDAALNWFELLSLRDRRPAQLSGGQMQRAALAKALVRRPQLLVLDEPLSQLDPALREQSRALLLSMTEQFGMTLLMVTHDSLDAMRLADRLAVLECGKLVQVDSPQAIYRRPNSSSIAETLSPFGVNQIGQWSFRPESGKLIGPAEQQKVNATADLVFEGVVLQLQFVGFATLALIEVSQSDAKHRIKVLVSDQKLKTGESVVVRVEKCDLLF